MLSSPSFCDDLYFFYPFDAEHNLVGWINPKLVDSGNDLFKLHHPKQIVPRSLFFDPRFLTFDPLSCASPACSWIAIVPTKDAVKFFEQLEHLWGRKVIEEQVPGFVLLTKDFWFVSLIVSTTLAPWFAMMTCLIVGSVFSLPFPALICFGFRSFSGLRFTTTSEVQHTPVRNILQPHKMIWRCILFKKILPIERLFWGFFPDLVYKLFFLIWNEVFIHFFLPIAFNWV